jgi:hypothetical protein
MRRTRRRRSRGFSKLSREGIQEAGRGTELERTGTWRETRSLTEPRPEVMAVERGLQG